MKRASMLAAVAAALAVGAIVYAQASGDKAPGATAPATQKGPEVNKQNPVVVIDTSMGTIKVELWPDKAPATVANFLKYVDKGFFDGTIFHRVIPGFMVQGGGFTPDMKQKPTDPPIKNESRADTKNQRGTLAMARTSDPDSATAQFFINVVDNDFLNKDKARDGVGYTVFAKVTDGMDVVDKIVKVPTKNAGPNQNVPVEPVLIRSAKKAEAK